MASEDQPLRLEPSAWGLPTDASVAELTEHLRALLGYLEAAPEPVQPWALARATEVRSALTELGGLDRHGAQDSHDEAPAHDADHAGRHGVRESGPQALTDDAGTASDTRAPQTDVEGESDGIDEAALLAEMGDEEDAPLRKPRSQRPARRRLLARRTSGDGAAAPTQDPASDGTKAASSETAATTASQAGEALTPASPGGRVAASMRQRGVQPKVQAETQHAPRKGRSAASTLLWLIFALGIIFAVYLAGRPTPPSTEMPDGHPPIGEMGEAPEGPSTAEKAERVAALQNAIEKDPSDTDARLELGVLLFNQRETSAAEEQWTAAVAEDPDLVQAWYNLGFLYLSKEPPEEDKARDAWQKVIDLAPDSDLAANVASHMDALTGQEESDE
ncbi:MAG: tetratricopeptide repeat protein [Bowdeniella nasicola]|nr:tetratricopeptide repeat protein [Bowdeniella nasicola]